MSHQAIRAAVMQGILAGLDISVTIDGDDIVATGPGGTVSLERWKDKPHSIPRFAEIGEEWADELKAKPKRKTRKVDTSAADE